MIACITVYGADLAVPNASMDVDAAFTNRAEKLIIQVPDLDIDAMLAVPAIAPATSLAPKVSDPVITNSAAPVHLATVVPTNETVSVPVAPALPAVTNAVPAVVAEPVKKEAAPVPVVPSLKTEAVAVVKPAAVATNAEPQGDAEATAERLQAVACELAAAKAKIMELAPSGRVSKLKELERKGLEYDSLSSKLELKDQMIARLMMELKAAQKVITNQVGAISELVASTNELTQAISRMNEEKAPLKEALDVLRLGKYEYYQVEKDDTCESIAAKPSIYNDASKQALIRQANKGSVANLDKLVPGEILVIPRVKVSERHDF